MHGSVCLLSRYLNHLLEGENSSELDISSADKSDNIFSNQNTLSTGWMGTCPIVNYYNNIMNDYTTEIDNLNDLINSKYTSLKNSYDQTNTLINSLFTLNNLTSAKPSGSTASLILKSEQEFTNKNNINLVGGEIYNDFLSKIETNKLTLDTYINNLNTIFVNNNDYYNSANSAYETLINFDTSVATASNVMNKRMIDIKDDYLFSQFWLMFITWAYMLFFGLIIFFYVWYICSKKDILWYFIIILVHLLFICMIVEMILSADFGVIRLVCHEIPRAMRFIFTGSYIVSGNSASYPAEFGNKDPSLTTIFTTCLNGDGDLNKLFSSTNIKDLNSLNSVSQNINNLQTNVKKIVDDSNLITNNYDNLQNSVLIKFINRLELMKDNLYMATEGFGSDDIYTILTIIRTNLDTETCLMSSEYYVIKAADCPSGSKQLDTIYYTSGENHCYVIPSLSSSASASYTNTGCNNAYINNAITFIKEIYSLINIRLNKLKELQSSYANTFNLLYTEINSLSSTLNSINSYLNSNTTSSSISNCGSVRYDLIDFCDFIGDTTEYDARIVVIFTAFIGVFGYVMLYTFLLVLNSFTATDNNYDDDYDGYNYSNNKKNKVRKLNMKRKESSEEEEEDYDNNNVINNNINNKGKNPPKITQKVEMSYMNKNNEDSDSS